MQRDHEICREWNVASFRSVCQRALYQKQMKNLEVFLSELNISADDVEAAMQGSYRLIKECNVIFKKEEHYPKIFKEWRRH